MSLDSSRERRMLARTQALMAAVSLIPLGVLFYIASVYVFEPLQEQGATSTIVSIFATLALTALVVIMGYVLVRRDTLRTIEAIGEGEARLARLREATASLATLHDPTDLRNRLCEVGGELVRARAAVLWDREGDDLRPAGALHISLDRARDLPLPIGQGLVGRAAEEKTTLRGEPSTDTDRSWDDRVRTKSESRLIVPLMKAGEVVAVLDLRNPAEPFGLPEQQLAEGLAQQAVLFLETSDFRAEQLRYAEAMTRLLADITDRHLAWPSHVENVQAICRHLAEAVGLDEHRTHVLMLAAAVHDIGLVDMPRVDVGPPGGPVDHPAAGGERLDASSAWAEIAPIVRAHHELMDGSGPQGLRGFAIPMPARILALAEYVESVTNPASPWGKKSVEEVLEELRDPNDRRFDPNVVKAFISLQEGAAQG